MTMQTADDKAPALTPALTPELTPISAAYRAVHSDIVQLLDTARHAAARSVNALMTATYWEIGRRIVESDQGGQDRAAYGEVLIERLSADLTQRFGRGFSRQNLWQMRGFHQAWPDTLILQTVSGELSDLNRLAKAFPLPWSAYVRLLSVKNESARRFYETEALRCGWSVRQLDRQVNSQFTPWMAYLIKCWPLNTRPFYRTKNC